MRWQLIKQAVVIFVIYLLLIVNVLPQEPELPRITADIWDHIDKAGTQEANCNADAVIVLDCTDITVESSGLAHTHIQQIVKILSDKGATQYTRLRFDYDPASNMVEIESVRIFRKSGMVEEITPDQILDLPQPQSSIVWGARMKLVPITRLTPGDAIVYDIYKKGFMIAYLGTEPDEDRYIPPMFGHFYDTVYFQEPLPVKIKHYRLKTKLDRPLQFECYNGSVATYVTFDDDYNIYTFWKTDIPAFHPEPDAPSPGDIITKVVLTTVPGWPEKSRWFYQVNEPVFPANAEIESLYYKITKDLQTDEEKFLALQAWVAREIRYFGITMGTGEGYTIHPSVMTFNDRCGVCKDKAGMLITLLRVGGYTAYPAMTMAGARVERIPADQFNHCVVAVKRDDDQYFMLDPTWAVLSREFWNSSESEQNFVIGSPEGEDLMMTSLAPPDTNLFTITSQATLSAAGDLEGTLIITGTNYIDQRLRRYLVHGATAADQKHLFEKWVGNIAPQAQLSSFPNDNAMALDLSKPIKVELSYRIPGYAILGDKHIVLTPPSYKNFIQGRLLSFLSMAKSKQRQYPIFLWFTQKLKIQETIRLPGGYKALFLPENKTIDTPAASSCFESNIRNNEFHFNAEIKIKLRTIPVQYYEDFKTVVDAINELSGHPIVLKNGKEEPDKPIYSNGDRK